MKKLHLTANQIAFLAIDCNLIWRFRWWFRAPRPNGNIDPTKLQIPGRTGMREGQLASPFGS